MEKLHLYDELSDKIRTFNEIFEIDYMNQSNNKKSWKEYLDPITRRLYNQTYFSFINENPIALNVPPGSLEKYYNIFISISEDFTTLLSLPIPNEIYCATSDVLETFNKFLIQNKFRVEKNKDISVDDNIKNIYRIYPSI